VLGRPERIHAVAAAVALAVATASAGCGGGASPRAPRGPGAGRPPVVIGSQNFTEQRILGELYAQALQAKGYRVRIRHELPSRAAADRALVDGRIDGYPEYVAAILATVAPDARPPGSAGPADRAVRRLEARRGFVALTPTPYARTDGLAATAAYARRHALTDIGGLTRVGRFTLGAVPDFELRPAGLPGLRRAYGLTNVVFRPLGSGAQYAALDAGRVQVAVVHTTDAVLRTGRHAVLADPQHVFGAGNVVPVFSRAVIAAEGPAFARTVDTVSAKLTTGAMRGMNAAVEVDKRTPADVARGFLRTNALL
jgi:osmoprotectant transport system substrate-binding protein